MYVRKIELSFGFKFDDLFDRDHLASLDAKFLEELKDSDVELYNELMKARAEQPDDYSELIISIGPHLEDFIGKLFCIEKEVEKLQASCNPGNIISKVKRQFVQRQALKKYRDPEHVGFEYSGDEQFAKDVIEWQEKGNEEKLEQAAKFASWASSSDKFPESILFNHPKKLDFENLVPVETIEVDGVQMMSSEHIEQRQGFDLTDHGCSIEYAQDQANYCIFCHNQDKDSCSKGLKDKEKNFKNSETGTVLIGCPLEEKISEMNKLRSSGFCVGALATVIIDNPMVAATGSRICNDCMKACIYQKQEPVDIPQIETRTLRDVLSLPWGFEIYNLLTMWNPLNIKRPLPKPDSGHKVLVAGMGPSGFTLAHHLLNDGHEIAGIDGLKIEPLEGINEPIKDINQLFEKLDERVLAGFGGVAEYGITVRWNKNYLKLIRILLERRKNFKLLGGVRFGSNITKEQAFELDFDHIALCIGAGKPTILNIPNALERGVRAASDFLMALQLTGAAKKDSIANLQIRLPIVVIGGGLTAIDTATESLAYYPVQVEKFLQRYEKLGGLDNLTEEEQIIADEFIGHAKALREEREKANPDILALLNKWGGVKLLYRKRFIDSPAYRLNHEEVEKALEEGISFIEQVTPTRFNVDEFQHITSLDVDCHGIKINFHAKTILVAAGTSPNTVLAREFPKEFQMDGKYLRAIDSKGNEVNPEKISKPDETYILTSIEDSGKSVSFLGDMHPSFFGNVVKAMASAKRGYPIISEMLSKLPSSKESGFLEKVENLLSAKVHKVNRLTPKIIEVIVNAPLAAKNFKPGQFYRLQNFEENALRTSDTTFAMEGLAMTGAKTDGDLISLIILEMGGSSNLCVHLKEGEAVVLMGPTGEPTEIKPDENVVLVGGGLGNAVLFSIGQAFRKIGSKVTYFAGYKQTSDRFMIDEIRKAADQIVWCCDEKKITDLAKGEKAFHGNIVEAMKANSDLLENTDRIITIGSDLMMKAVEGARKTIFKPDIKSIASINSPMQCMMKEICAQCLQKHIDPDTGIETFVFSCTNQDQCSKKVDFAHLHQRLKQNSLQEKLTAKWIEKGSLTKSG